MCTTDLQPGQRLPHRFPLVRPPTQVEALAHESIRLVM